jgi:hypothetical protein
MVELHGTEPEATVDWLRRAWKRREKQKRNRKQNRSNRISKLGLVGKRTSWLILGYKSAQSLSESKTVSQSVNIEKFLEKSAEHAGSVF